MDLSVNYSIPVFKSLSRWVKLEVLNVLNNQKLIGWNTTVRPDPASSLDDNALRTGYVKGPAGARTSSTPG